jgi:hypothetical protein
MATTQASRRNRKTNATSLPPSAPLPSSETIGDLLKRLGHIPPERVRLRPTPGTATEKDVLDVLDRENRPCELVEGTLVEKAMGYEESEIAGLLLTFLNNFVRPRKLGIVTGADGTIRLFPGLVRIPDVAFASWGCFPDRKRPKARIPQLAPSEDGDSWQEPPICPATRLTWARKPSSMSSGLFSEDATLPTPSRPGYQSCALFLAASFSKIVPRWRPA